MNKFTDIQTECKAVMKSFQSLFPVLLLAVFVTACTPDTPEPSPTGTAPPTVTPVLQPTATETRVPDPPTIPIDLSGVEAITPTLPISEQTVFGFTYQQADGNRVADGLGALTSAQPIDLQLNGIPIWVVGVPIDGGGSIWSAVLEDGRVQSFHILADIITPIEVGPNPLPPGMPPLMMIHQGAPRFVTAPGEDASPYTHPVIIRNDPAHLAYIARNGDLVVSLAGETTRLEVDALPDARILQDEAGRLLLLTGASTDYRHAVLGDGIESGSITLVGTDPVEILQVISTGSQVVEGTAPIWTDFDGDGEREIIVTLADEFQGAQIIVFSEGGQRLYRGPAIGRGYRWRHQLLAAPFIPNQGIMLVDNLTPHLDAVTEFYRLDPEFGLVVATSIAGFSTHQLGSRNLDQALAGDLDGDGQIELLVPSVNGEYLGSLRLQGGNAVVAWTVATGTRMTSNLAAVELLDGTLAVGAGLSNGLLRLWLP